MDDNSVILLLRRIWDMKKSRHGRQYGLLNGTQNTLLVFEDRRLVSLNPIQQLWHTPAKARMSK